MRTPARSWRWSAVAALLLAASLAVTSCVEHPVGPARTADDYERKARTTARSALSAVETVRLLADTAAAGDAFSSYVAVAISEQEDSLGGLRGTFASIQPPPGDDLIELRDELDELLDSSFDHVGDVRIETRRGNLDDLDALAAPLADDAAALRALIEELA